MGRAFEHTSPLPLASVIQPSEESIPPPLQASAFPGQRLEQADGAPGWAVDVPGDISDMWPSVIVQEPRCDRC
jgi:hypothetical protein